MGSLRLRALLGIIGLTLLLLAVGLPMARVALERSFEAFELRTAEQATLRLRLDPPGGALGDAAVRLLGTTPIDLAVDGVLRRFKSLVETGEIPTTERQPAARAHTR